MAESTTTTAAVPVVDIDRSKLLEMMNKEGSEQPMVIDVREPDEVEATGTIDTGTNIPMATVPSKLEEMRKSGEINNDTVLVFSCRSGRRSAAAADTVKDMGFTHVYNYTGGANDWFAAR